MHFLLRFEITTTNFSAFLPNYRMLYENLVIELTEIYKDTTCLNFHSI